MFSLDYGTGLAFKTSASLRAVLTGNGSCKLVIAADIASSPVLTVDPDDDLHTALRRFTQKIIDDIPNVDPEYKSQILGMLSRRDVISAYHDRITELQRVDEVVSGQRV